MLVTLEESKNVTSRSKALAPSNMRSMVSTLPVFQNAKGLLNAEALRNSLSIKMTFEVSHLEISPLKLALFSNALLMFVTRLVSQFDMTSKFVVDFPYVWHSPETGASARHAVTATMKVTSLNRVLLIRCLHELKIVSSLHSKFAWNWKAPRKIPLWGVFAANPSQSEISRAKAIAFWNIDSIFVTLLVSQRVMSPLKVDLSLNAPRISATCLTFQSGITPKPLEAPKFSHKPYSGSSARHEAREELNVKSVKHSAQAQLSGGPSSLQACKDINAVASRNMFVVFSKLEVFQSNTGWENEIEPANMRSIFVTMDVSQSDIVMLKFSASSNILDMSVTWETFQDPISWLKVVAALNMPRMVLTPLVSHREISALKSAEYERFAPNVNDISVTKLVSQSSMMPKPVVTVP